MAIPGTPNTFNVQTANGQVLISWGITAGATSYIVQRSLDGVTYTGLATIASPILPTLWLDTAVSLGVNYYYQVQASNTSGSSGFTVPQSAIPTGTGELSLGAIRLKAQQRADRVNSNFVTLPEWNSYINQSMFELYDLLITTYEDYFIAPPISFNSVSGQQLYPLPTGLNQFLNQSGATITPSPFYKLTGVDLALNTSQNAWITLNKFNFIDRNKYVYPTAGSTIYGMYNIKYRVIGSNIEFIPFPASGQLFQLWYIPRLTELLQDTDITTVGISGWAEYVIVKAAYYALTKEESDTSSLVMQLAALTKRIEETAANRDAGQPDTISETRNQSSNGFGPGWSGSGAGW